jgi:hypothetical protein
LRIAQEELGPHFYCIHGRLGDLAYKWGGKTSLSVFVRTPEFSSWNKDYPVYLASDDPNNVFFAELKSEVEVVTGDKLQGEGVNQFKMLFATPKVRQDMFGILDKLICAQSLRFIGSSFSTFTVDILRMRSQLRFVFPEFYEIKHGNASASG